MSRRPPVPPQGSPDARYGGDQRHGLGAGPPGGDGWWRTLDERADDPAFQERLHNEFPSQVETLSDPVARRAFLKLMGASLGLAGITACTTQPTETIVPYVRQPEEVVPGRPLFYATSMTIGGVATGVLVESHEGRPTKVEGNPQHPASLGATDIFAQAAILNLYDPDRSRALTHVGEIRPWPEFLAALAAALTAQQAVQGRGLRLLTESVSSPTLAAQIRELVERYPSARWHQWDPASRENVRVGARLAFGEFVDSQLHLDQARVVLALDADFLGSGAGSLKYTRDFAARRRPELAAEMCRLYALESMPTATGARADHRLPVRPSEVEAFARQIAAAVGVAGVAGGPALSGRAAEQAQAWVAGIAQDLLAHKGAGLIVAGDSQPPVVHALAFAMNAALGNTGRTIVFTDPVEAAPVEQAQSLQDLVRDMIAGQVDILIVLGGNPVFTAPADLNLRDAMAKVPLRVHLSQHVDETSELCHWQIPEAHFLEAWSDARAYDGTASIVQPLIAPLYDGRSAHEVLAAMSETPEKAPYDLVREHWTAWFEAEASRAAAPAAGAKTAAPVGDPAAAFELAWRRWLHDGVIPNTAFAPRTMTVRPEALAASPRSGNEPAGYEIVFRNDPCVLDGRFANNGWLQELPKPVTKLTWDNAVLVSPATAARLEGSTRPALRGGEHGQVVTDVVELRSRGRSVRGPLFPVAGHPDDCLTVYLGYGRTRGGEVGAGAGFNAGALRTSGALWFDRGVEVAKTGDRYSLACTQYHHLMEGRGMVRSVTREELERDPKIVHEGHEAPPRTLTLIPDYAYEGYKWGMAIDVNACTGCNACIVGCQAENNIPVVGKDQVLRGREMHWLRVDTYYRGVEDNPEMYFQPVPCMHCENAPCEVVCPVNATVHSHEGLNDMVYNRCVGTRYCSNNCPYKVRRFNYLLYQDWETPSLKLGRNPDVTVRSRGVMEKCTYCVQRINSAKIDSEKAGRRVADGEIKTACEAACPAEAIVFGNLNDPASRVSKLQVEPRNYSMLAELNTRPRTTYLAAVRNPNPELGE
jgi:molybdopterin-containing oxidoreductase family iron-sulfur binding subunit